MSGSGTGTPVGSVVASTAGEIISSAFQKIGIDSPSTPQTTSALTSLNDLISLQGADFMIPYKTSETLSITTGDAEYTIGPSGDLNTVRPLKIESCFLRDSDNKDWPVQVMAGTDYNKMYDKALELRPTKVYYLTEYPLAKIKFNYEPDTSYTAYFEFIKNFTEFALTTTSVSLPNEYKAFLVSNLAVSLAEDWDRVVSKTLYAMAQNSKEIIDKLNATNKPCSKAKFDMFSGGTYQIETDSYESR